VRFIKTKKGSVLLLATLIVAGAAAFGAYAYFTTSGLMLSLPLPARGLPVFFQVSVLLLVSAALVRASAAMVGGGGHAGLAALRVCGPAWWPVSCHWARGLVGLHASQGQGDVCRRGACLIPACAGGR
jgi:hypothetical protein